MGKIQNKLHNLVSNKWFLFCVCILLGQYGIHRFLMRRWWTGILVIVCACVGLGSIWSIVDAVLIVLEKLTPCPRRVKTAKVKKAKNVKEKKDVSINYTGPLLVKNSNETTTTTI